MSKLRSATYLVKIFANEPVKEARVIKENYL
jgi:hypothetical protein